MPVETISRDAAETLTVGELVVERFPVGPQRANAYLAYGGHSRRGVVIDPGAEGDVLTARIDQLGLAVPSVLLTHGHWDHVGAAVAIAAHTGAAVHIHPLDVPLLKAAPFYAFRVDGVQVRVPSVVTRVEHGSALHVDERHTLVARHVPGHTAGGVAYRSGRVLFTGDTLMPAGASRVDLPGGDADALGRSLATLADELADDDIICPGHGSSWAATAAKAWVASQQGPV